MFTLKVRLYRMRTRTRPTRTRTRTRLLSSFAIQIEHEPERGKPSTAFEAARLFLAVRDKIWSFGIMAQVESDTEEIIVLYLYFFHDVFVIFVCFVIQYMILLSFKNHGFCLVHCSPNFTSKID